MSTATFRHRRAGAPGRTTREAGARRRGAARGWLILAYQLPTSPSRARVKTWRRLQQLGAVAIRNAVHVLPDCAQSREDFEWLKAEILAGGGEASVFAATTIDSLTDDDIAAAFRADRERSFRAIAADARKLARRGTRAGAAKGTELRRLQRAVRQLRDRFTQVVSGDFFGAGGREEAATALVELERLVAGPGAGRPAPPEGEGTLDPKDYRGRLWFTRPRPGIDRAASAWLIRRFIDPLARFAFGDGPASSRAVPFDMYDAEFSHHADSCTFEVLARRFGIEDPAVSVLGRLVHDVDLKDARYNVPEAPAIGRVIDGLRQTFAGDEELLEHGIVLFEALYRAFASPPATIGAGAPHGGRPRGRKGRSRMPE